MRDTSLSLYLEVVQAVQGYIFKINLQDAELRCFRPRLLSPTLKPSFAGVGCYTIALSCCANKLLSGSKSSFNFGAIGYSSIFTLYVFGD